LWRTILDYAFLIITRSNILPKAVKICDFGVSLKLDENLEAAGGDNGEYVGTGPWSAMEVRVDR
jgi:hypothetical protein